MEFLFLVAAFAAEVIGTVAGFGSSTIALPLSLFFFDFPLALVLVAFMHIFGNLGRLGWFKQSLDKGILLRFGVPSVIFTVIGAFLVSYIDQDVLKGILGLFLVGYVLIVWSNNFIVKSSPAKMLVGGGISGFLAGLIGTGGALRGAFLTTFDLPKEKYLATAAAIAILVDLTRLPIYLQQGFLPSQFYWLVPVLFVIGIAGSYVGRQIVRLIPQERFRKLVLVAILMIGLSFVYIWLS